MSQGKGTPYENPIVSIYKISKSAIYKENCEESHRESPYSFIGINIVEISDLLDSQTNSIKKHRG